MQTPRCSNLSKSSQTFIVQRYPAVLLPVFWTKQRRACMQYEHTAETSMIIGGVGSMLAAVLAATLQLLLCRNMTLITVTDAPAATRLHSPSSAQVLLPPRGKKGDLTKDRCGFGFDSSCTPRHDVCGADVWSTEICTKAPSLKVVQT